MKQIVLISGKGGTGKTVITAAFSSLAKNKVIADCDVDAADLHLLLSPKIKNKTLFESGFIPEIDKKLCNKCGECLKVCRFQAIKNDITIDSIACEGCGFCSFVCPQNAITMKKNTVGELYISDTKFGPMVHAKLGIAEENSGKLVSLVRKNAKEIAQKNNSDYVIIDGSPGIGCPVIASLSGVDLAVVITEPTLSGLHDADRVTQVAKHFGIQTKIVINKYDLNKDIAKKIENFAKKENIPILGKISFDKNVVTSVINAKTIIDYKKSKARKQIIDIWKNLKSFI